jgi:hypothetical protein
MPTWSLQIDVEGLEDLSMVGDVLQQISEDQNTFRVTANSASEAIEATTISWNKYASVMFQVSMASKEEITNLVQAKVFYEESNRAMQERLNTEYEMQEIARVKTTYMTDETNLIEGITIATRILKETQDELNVTYENQMSQLEVFTERQKLRHEGTWEEVADLEQVDIALGIDTETRKNNEMAMREQNKAQINSSISLFVMSIVLTQWATTLKRVAGDNVALGKTFDDMRNAIVLVILPFQTYNSVLMLARVNSISLAAASTALLSAFGGMFFILLGINEQAPAIKAGLIGIGVAMLALSAYTWLHAQAVTAQKIAEAGWLAPAMAAVILGSIGAGVAYVASLQKAETFPGMMRMVTESGPIYAHRGEEIGRVSNQSTINEGGLTVNVNMASGAVMSESLIDRLVDEINTKIAGGSLSSIRSSRRVIV